MRPRLIHPCAVTLLQVDSAASAVDPITREPVGAVPTVARSLVGQVRETRGERLRMTTAGADATANAAGRVVFEIDALAAAGVTVALGDRITVVAGRAVNWRVLRVEQHAQYRGRPHHLWAFFDDEAAS